MVSQSTMLLETTKH